MEPVERRIGEHRYRLGVLPYGKGKPVLVRLAKLLGGPLGKLVDGGGGPGNLSSLLDTKLNVGAALAELAQNLNETDLDYLCEVFGQACQVEMQAGKWIPVAQVAEIHFAGKYALMFRWLAACLEVNFADFFGGPGNGLGGLEALFARPPASASPLPPSQAT